MKKKVAAWKPPALTGFFYLCRKDNQHKRKIAVSEVISLMESLTLPWDQNSTQKLVLEMQERQMTYRKIQEMVSLQEKIKKRLKDKDQRL